MNQILVYSSLGAGLLRELQKKFNGAVSVLEWEVFPQNVKNYSAVIIMDDFSGSVSATVKFILKIRKEFSKPIIVYITGALSKDSMDLDIVANMTYISKKYLTDDIEEIMERVKKLYG